MLDLFLVFEHRGSKQTGTPGTIKPLTGLFVVRKKLLKEQGGEWKFR